MRIVGGQWRGRILAAPQGDAIRPTSDKARQAIFNSLLSGRFDVTLDDAQVMDGTAGTGAMGIEALSRGAAHCHFVDSAPAAIALIRSNLTSLKATPELFTLHKYAAQLLPIHKGAPCDLVFLDPPYHSGLLNTMVTHLRDMGWANNDTLFVIEESADAAVQLDATILDRKLYGVAQVIYCR